MKVIIPRYKIDLYNQIFDENKMKQCIDEFIERVIKKALEGNK